MSTIAIIPARHGSTRFPGKPLALLWGKPMIQHTYENTQRATLLDDVYVATDDQRIADVVTGFGGKYIMTESDIESGSVRCHRAIKYLEHHKSYHQITHVVNIQGDKPLVNPDHIDLLIRTLKQNNSMVALAAKIETQQELFDRATTKVVFNRNHQALYFSRAVIPHSKDGQYHPDTIYYKNCGMYGFERTFLDIYAKTPMTPLQQEEDLEQLKTLEMGYPITMAVVEKSQPGIDYPKQLDELNTIFENTK